jgi:hypothetical protein
MLVNKELAVWRVGVPADSREGKRAIRDLGDRIAKELPRRALGLQWDLMLSEGNGFREGI